jgi:hypothetical protein
LAAYWLFHFLSKPADGLFAAFCILGAFQFTGFLPGAAGDLNGLDAGSGLAFATAPGAFLATPGTGEGKLGLATGVTFAGAATGVGLATGEGLTPPLGAIVPLPIGLGRMAAIAPRLGPAKGARLAPDGLPGLRRSASGPVGFLSI